jgi:hypothetical protein
MTKKANNVYQFKIVLENIKPLIWRRIQVPENYNFWELHVAIQDAMGWLDCHLHQFYVNDPKTGGEPMLIGIPDDECPVDIPTLAGWKTRISDFFSLRNKKIVYEYDFGDGWSHVILLEKILQKDPGVKYPICIAGKRACPPEDCGGFWGYEELIKIFKDPLHEEYQDRIDWLGKIFEPELFNHTDVVFDDPKNRLQEAMMMDKIKNLK